jgi:hypothetical protein
MDSCGSTKVNGIFRRMGPNNYEKCHEWPRWIKDARSRRILLPLSVLVLPSQKLLARKQRTGQCSEQNSYWQSPYDNALSKTLIGKVHMIMGWMVGNKCGGIQHKKIFIGFFYWKRSSKNAACS